MNKVDPRAAWKIKNSLLGGSEDNPLNKDLPPAFEQIDAEAYQELKKLKEQYEDSEKRKSNDYDEDDCFS